MRLDLLEWLGGLAWTLAVWWQIDVRRTRTSRWRFARFPLQIVASAAVVVSHGMRGRSTAAVGAIVLAGLLAFVVLALRRSPTRALDVDGPASLAPPQPA